MTFDAPPDRPQRTKHLPFTVLLGGPALLLALTLTLGYRYSVGSPSQNVTMGDRAFVITVTELLELLKRTDGYDPRSETLTKTKLGRGGRELRYDYPATAKPQWGVRGRVIAELDARQAEATYREVVLRELDGVETKPFDWGDEARLGTNAFVGRSGQRVVFYRLEGVPLEAPLTFETIIASHLAQVETFDP